MTTEYPRPDELPKQQALNPAVTWAALIACFGVLGLLFFPLYGNQNHPMRIACLSDVKQITMGLLIYENDYDNLLPRANIWADSTFPYVKTKTIFNEPTLKDQSYGYAFNSRLGGKKVPDKDLVNRPMVFESQNLIWNAADPLASLCVPARHTTSNNFGFADGHAKALALDKTPHP